MQKKRRSIVGSLLGQSSLWGRSKLFKRHTLADNGLDPSNTKPPNRVVTSVLNLGAVGLLLTRTMSLVFTAKTDKGASVKMAHRFTNESASFIIVSMAFVGMIMVYQSTEQLSRSIGDTQLVGASFIKLLIRVLGPTVMGLLLACRVGAGIAAEIGAMAVTEQLDAMRMCAADPIETLMVPRLRGGIIAGLTLAILGCGSALLSGLITAQVCFSISVSSYWNVSLVDAGDVLQGVVKALAYGVAVPIVSGSYGLHARGGARGVGQATTDAVVGSSFAIIVLDSILSLIAHAVFG